MTKPSTDAVISAARMIRLNLGHVWVVLQPDGTRDSIHNSALAAKEEVARAWLFALGRNAESRHITWRDITDAQSAGWRIVECELTPVAA